MCGICGFIGFDDEELLLRMTAQLVHRGPDEGGYYLGPGIGLGHRRLSIIDLSSSRQPLCNEDGTIWIVYNGEIYNFKEIRKDLERRGHRFRTRGDTEVIVHAYEEYGIDCLQRFNGMWAFALWDLNERSLVIARDRLGVKPVCYYQAGDRLLFASEYKAILQYPPARSEVELKSIDEYLSRRYVPDARTMFKGLHKLPQAHYLVFKGGKAEIHRYWSLHFAEEPCRADDEWLEEFREVFTDSVRLRLISDVPLGVFLSGGLDSSAIVGTMAELNHRPIETFSVAFNSVHDETEPARFAARTFAAEHHDLVTQPDDLQLLPEIIWHQEDPIGDAIVVPLYLLSRMARDYVKVVLTGEGADELLGGYIHQTALLKAAQLDRFMPLALRRFLAMLVRVVPVGMLDLFFHYPASMGEEGRKRLAAFIGMDNLADRYKLIGSLFTVEEKENLYREDLFDQLQGRVATDRGNSTMGGEHGDQIIAREFQSWLPDNILFKQDRLSMANSLEARVPFLDYRLVELAARLPRHLKNDGKSDKVALRRALAHLLPAAIRKRRKQAFYMPLEGNYRKKFWELAHTYLSPERIRRRRLFNEAGVQLLMARADRSSLIHYKQLMALIILEIWFDIFIDGCGFPDKAIRDKNTGVEVVKFG